MKKNINKKENKMRKLLLVLMLGLVFVLSGCVNKEDYYTKEQMDLIIKDYESEILQQQEDDEDLENDINDLEDDIHELRDRVNSLETDLEIIIDTVDLLKGVVNNHTTDLIEMRDDVDYAYWYMEDNYSLILDNSDYIFINIALSNMLVEFNDIYIESGNPDFRNTTEYQDWLDDWEDTFIEEFGDLEGFDEVFYEGFLDDSTNWH